MPYVDGIYVPDPDAEADVPADMLLLQQSLRGRIVRRHSSTADRDTAVSVLPAAVRRSAVVYVPGVGFMGYTKADDPYDASDASWWKFDRIRAGHIDSEGAQTNQMHSIPASACFFDGQPPTAVMAFSTTSQLYVDFSAGTPRFDGSQAFVRAVDRRTETIITGAVSFFWIAVR